MKKIKINHLHFKKYSIAELNKTQMYKIYGGSDDSPSSYCIIPLTHEPDNTATGPKVAVSVNCNM